MRYIKFAEASGDKAEESITEAAKEEEKKPKRRTSKRGHPG